MLRQAVARHCRRCVTITGKVGKVARRNKVVLAFVILTVTNFLAIGDVQRNAHHVSKLATSAHQLASTVKRQQSQLARETEARKNLRNSQIAKLKKQAAALSAAESALKEQQKESCASTNKFVKVIDDILERSIASQETSRSLPNLTPGQKQQLQADLEAAIRIGKIDIAEVDGAGCTLVPPKAPA